MASFYPSLSIDDNMLLQPYDLLNQKNDFHQSSEFAFAYQNVLPVSYHELEPSIIAVSHAPKESIHGSDRISHYHGLSLTLGSQLELQLPQYSNTSFGSMLSSNMQARERNLYQDGEFKNDYEFTGMLSHSKYLEATQELLGELVSVREALESSEKGHNRNSIHEDGCKGWEAKTDGDFFKFSQSSNNASREPSASERQDLQGKVAKLVDLLDEVDRKYKQYRHQMEAIASSFDAISGRGAAHPYTNLALKTISRQFRCLHDAIKRKIQSMQRSLGEQDSNSEGILSRLRYIDQQLRRQKALGFTRQHWRPQRGLPESSVSVLRAWLFEHFLHPYPKESEKLVLARETGLTRGQVANWFINARVRLWKPMIEEMYREEIGKTETGAKPLPELAITNRDHEDFQTTMIHCSNNKRPNYVVSRAELSHESADFPWQKCS